MKADITRQTFNRLNRFSGVLMQQGRVQLDADWNEQAAIATYNHRRLAADLFGPHGGPHGAVGFAVRLLDAASLPQGETDFYVAPGHYYVDGILCELDATPIPIVLGTTNNTSQVKVDRFTVDGVPFKKSQYVLLSDQSHIATATPTARIIDIDYGNRLLTLTDISSWVSGGLGGLLKPQNPMIQRLTTFRQQPDASPASLPTGDLQVYLDVWERAVTTVEDDSLREVALGGADTAARTRVVWQVRALGLPAGQSRACLLPQTIANELRPANRGLLRARAQPTQASTDPCTIAPDALYRGPENQLYRVEIHAGSLDASGSKTTPTFKWSRENGAVAFAIGGGGGTTTLTLDNLGRDDRFGLAEGDWVEVEDDKSVLANRVGPLLQVQSIDRTRNVVMLAGTAASDIGNDATTHPRLRRWDHKAAEGITLGADKAVQIPASAPPTQWIELEDGVQIQFVNVAQSVFQTGDYWLIPARVATGDVIWPKETVPIDPNAPLTQAIALPPDGVTHHYAPLAVIGVGPAGVQRLTECRFELAGPTAVT